MLPGMRTFFGRQWSIKQEDPTGDSPLKTFGGKTSDCESVRGGGEGTGRPFFWGGGDFTLEKYFITRIFNLIQAYHI